MKMEICALGVSLESLCEIVALIKSSTSTLRNFPLAYQMP